MSEPLALSAVLLAAGLSSRMGGPHKLLLDMGGEPMIRRMARTLLAISPVEVMVVTGHRAEEVRDALAGLPLGFAHNAAYTEGQPGSVVTGVRALSRLCHAVMVVPGDQPLLTPELLARLIAAYRAAPAGRSILVPIVTGERGMPLIFAAHHIPEIGAGGLRIGCRRLVETRPEAVSLVEMADAAFIRDCDTPADYAALRQTLSLVEATSA